MRLHYICTNNKYDLDNYLCKEMLLFSFTQHFLFPPDFLFWLFIWKYCVFNLLILARQSSVDLQNSRSLSLMSWHTLLKMSIFLLGVVSNCCWTWSSPYSSINKTCKRTTSIAIELNKVKLHMRMLGAKNTRALLRIFIIDKTMAARRDS
jgi:hypothetical protein